MMLSEKSLDIALNLASDSTILKLKNKKLNSYNSTQKLKEEQEKREEKIQKHES